MVTSTTDALSASAARRGPEHALHGYVRKIESAEILVHDWRPDSEESQVVTLKWPGAHAFYTLCEDVTSPLLFTESIRQALALLSHTVHHIPLDHRLGWEYARSTVAPAALWRGPTPAVVDMRITHSAVSRRRFGSVQVTAEIEAASDGAYVGSAEIRYVTHPPAFYRRLRGRYADAAESFARTLAPAPPVAAAQVGRDRPRDVVIAPTGTPHRWQLRTDTTHEVLFDHSHDHVPGMVLLEAAAQAAQAEAGPRRVLAVGYETTFFRYVELDQPCWITAEPAAPDLLGRSRLKVDGVQGGRVVSSTLVATEPLDATPAS
ncbi:adhesin [Streptomyces sulfonofaciens]|uniref:Adhesin n=1 Tax=Streptomyces sulfonofaciens TaxID=68272 RepID=A0A919FUK4_9ACTN|nr:ScbA/BarX family gamma-butyrolactone biosynthesis protein [Streptomyces sulfonofaciens]GHH72698.1 adhesin [Streptomyces sulfonofaciens]